MKTTSAFSSRKVFNAHCILIHHIYYTTYRALFNNINLWFTAYINN